MKVAARHGVHGDLEPPEPPGEEGAQDEAEQGHQRHLEQGELKGPTLGGGHDREGL